MSLRPESRKKYRGIRIFAGEAAVGGVVKPQGRDGDHSPWREPHAGLPTARYPPPPSTLRNDIGSWRDSLQGSREIAGT